MVSRLTGILALLGIVLLNTAGAKEQLLVFVQSGASPVDTHFQESILPGVRALAEKRGIDVHVLEAKEGAPKEVTITPLLVYQNHRGRSIYQGRTTTLDRVETFLRTSKFVPQGDEKLPRENVPVWSNGRQTIAAPIKITDLAGEKPWLFSQESFVTDAREALANGFERFAFKEKVALGRGARSFYMDFYPYRGDDGKFFLSLALFSQFHCKEPVFATGDTPLSGTWSDRSAVWAEAAKVFEREIAKVIATAESGDAFDIVGRDVPVTSWEELGYPLPPKPERSTDIDPASIVLTDTWTLKPTGTDDPPAVQFRFPAPLDNYTGVVGKVTGSFEFGTGQAFSGAKGKVIADPSTVVMGDADLDDALQGSIFLHTKRFPASSFTIKQMTTTDPKIEFGRLVTGTVHGTFTLKDTSIDLSAPFEAEAVLGDDGTPQLLMRSRFTIDLQQFDIEEADGPAPARHTLVFDTHFAFTPASGEGERGV